MADSISLARARAETGLAKIRIAASDTAGAQAEARNAFTGEVKLGAMLLERKAAGPAKQLSA